MTILTLSRSVSCSVLRSRQIETLSFIPLNWSIIARTQASCLMPGMRTAWPVSASERVSASSIRPGRSEQPPIRRRRLMMSEMRPKQTGGAMTMVMAMMMMTIRKKTRVHVPTPKTATRRRGALRNHIATPKTAQNMPTGRWTRYGKMLRIKMATFMIQTLVRN